MTSQQWAKWVIEKRVAIVATCLLVILALGFGGSKLKFDNDYRMFFGEDNPELIEFEKMQSRYTKADNVLIMLEPKSGDVFTPDVLSAVYQLTDQIEKNVSFSLRIDSLSSYHHTFAADDEITIEPLIRDPSELTQERVQEIKSIVLNEPLLVNRLVSPSADVTGINVTIGLPGENTMTEAPQVMSDVNEVVRQFEQKNPDIKVYVTGLVAMNNAFPEASQNDFNVLIPLAFFMIIISLLIYMRSLSATVITVLVILLSIAGAMGLAGWLGIKLSPASVSAPTMILTIAVADCVHFLVTYLQQIRRGFSKEKSIEESMRLNLQPMFLTSATTALGFLSLNFSDSPPFHDLGNITAVGVLIAFLLSISFLPALAAILPVSAARSEEAANNKMKLIGHWITTHYNKIFYSVTVVVIILIAFVPRNELNDQFVNYFDEGVKFRDDTDYVTEKLTGMYFIDYSLSSGKAGGVSDPAFLLQLDAFSSWLEEQDEVIHVNSYDTVIKRINRVMHNDDPAHYKIPDTLFQASQLFELYSSGLAPKQSLTNQINTDKSQTRVSITLKTLSSNDLIAFEKKVTNWLATNTVGITFENASPVMMFAHIGQRNIYSMLIGTTVALLLISLLLIVALKSWKYGLLSLIPNLLPAFVSFGLWGLLVGQVGLGLSVVMGMTLGIVVDDTVHFLSKYLRAKREQQLTPVQAVHYAFENVGSALIITSLALMAGFLVLFFSSFQLNSGMGLMTAITIGVALLLDFFYLPSVLLKTEK